VEASPRLDRSADDDELGAALGGDARDLLTEAPGARTDDLLPHSDPVRAGNRGRTFEPSFQARERAVHVGIERQLAIDHQRRDKDDARAAIGREPAGEIERVLRLVLVEQRHDDAPVGDRAAPTREAPCAEMERPEVGQLHLMSW
jgi:hypothetical protein